MSQADWQARTRNAQTRLEPLRFLLGRWSGTGTSHGEPITASLSVQLRLSGTFVEAHERLLDASGALDHEDISFYRYSSTEDQLRVRQMMVPALLSERMVLVLPEGGIRWYEGPLGVQVYFEPQPDGTLAERVFLPMQKHPAVTIRYQREP